MFFKIGVLKKFLKLHRKALVMESLFKKLAGWRLAILLKKDSFPVKFVKFSRTQFFTEHLR